MGWTATDAGIPFKWWEWISSIVRPVYLSLEAWRSTFSGSSPTWLVLGRSKGHWFLSVLRFLLSLSGTGYMAPQRNRGIKRQSADFIAKRRRCWQPVKLIQVWNMVVSFWIGFWKELQTTHRDQPHWETVFLTPQGGGGETCGTWDVPKCKADRLH